MAQNHPSHDWSSNTWTCVNCAAIWGGLAASLPCAPSTDDSPEAIADVAEANKPAPDYSKITADFAR